MSHASALVSDRNAESVLYTSNFATTCSQHSPGFQCKPRMWHALGQMLPFGDLIFARTDKRRFGRQGGEVSLLSPFKDNS